MRRGRLDESPACIRLWLFRLFLCNSSFQVDLVVLKFELWVESKKKTIGLQSAKHVKYHVTSKFQFNYALATVQTIRCRAYNIAKVIFTAWHPFYFIDIAIWMRSLLHAPVIWEYPREVQVRWIRFSHVAFKFNCLIDTGEVSGLLTTTATWWILKCKSKKNYLRRWISFDIFLSMIRLNLFLISP